MESTVNMYFVWDDLYKKMLRFEIEASASAVVKSNSKRYFRIPDVKVGDFLLGDDTIYEVVNSNRKLTDLTKTMVLWTMKEVNKVIGYSFEVNVLNYGIWKDLVLIKGAKKMLEESFKEEFTMKYANTIDVNKLRDYLKESTMESKIIHITTDGIKVVTARMGDIEATAKCHDDDVFDYFIGAKIALDRLRVATEKAKKRQTLDKWYSSLSDDKKEYLKDKFSQK